MKKGIYLMFFNLLLLYPGIAQYQIKNGNFQDWSNIGTNSEHPLNWNSIKNGSTGLWASSAQQVLYRSTDVPHNGITYSIKLQSKSILGIIANGAVSTGAFNIGSTNATSSNNYAYTNTTNSDYSNNLITKPDSISFWVKYIPSSNSGSNNAKMGATIHSNAEYRDPESSNNSAQYVVGKATLNIPKIGNGEWHQYTIPFQYTGPSQTPAFILVNFSTNITPGGGSAGDQLFIADIELIYNRNLNNILIDGTPLTNFEPSNTEYFIETDHIPVVTASAYSPFITSLNTTQATQDNLISTISVLHGGTAKTYMIHFTLTNKIESILNPEIRIFPNPSNGKISICNIIDNGLSNIDVIDLNGKSIMSIKKISTSKIDLDLGRLCSGIYNIIYSNNTFKKTYKIVIH